MTPNKTMVLTLMLVLLSRVNYAQDLILTDQHGKIPANSPVKRLDERIAKEGSELFAIHLSNLIGPAFLMEAIGKQNMNMDRYLSYRVNASTYRCIFFKQGKNLQVLASVDFLGKMLPENATYNTNVRPFTPLERQLHQIQTKGFDMSDKDPRLAYKNRNTYYMLPIVSNKENKLYIMTVRPGYDTITFGNDFLIKYDAKGNELSFKKLHQEETVVFVKSKDVASADWHVHNLEDDPYLTPTDICALLIGQCFAHWETYSVYSLINTSIWDCKSNQGFVVPTDTLYKRQYGQSYLQHYFKAPANVTGIKIKLRQ